MNKIKNFWKENSGIVKFIAFWVISFAIAFTAVDIVSKFTNNWRIQGGTFHVVGILAIGVGIWILARKDWEEKSK